MKMFNYLKKLKLTGEEIKEGIKVLAIYSHHFSKTINDLPLYPSEKDKFEMNFSMVRKNIADEVIQMFLYEIDRVRIPFDNPKFLTKIYKAQG